MKIHKLRIMVLFLILTLFFSCKAVYAKSPDKQYSILYLSSYSYSFSTVPQQIKGLNETLNPDLYSIDYEFMDSKRFSSNEDISAFYNYIKAKLDSLPKYDVIIAADDAALSFTMKYRKDLFDGIPVVFLGINDVATAMDAAKNDDVTGIIEKASYQENIDLIRKILPKTKNIVAITDDTQTGIGDRKQFKACTDSNPELDFSIIDTSELTEQEIEDSISNVENGSVILYLTFFEDTDGNRYTIDSAAKLISEYAKVPVFRLSYGGVGNGILGGILISYEEMGIEAGKMTVSILNGTDIKNIAVVTECPTYGYFDENVLKKYNINDKLLPKDSIIINKDVNFYSAHTNLCNMVIFIFVFLFTIISFLFIDVKRKKKAAQKLSESQVLINEAISNSDIQFFTYFPDKKKAEIYSLNERYSNLSKVWNNFPDSFFDLIKPSKNDELRFRNMVKSIDSGADNAECTIQMLYRGIYIWQKVKMTAIRDNKSRTVKAQCFAMDVTAQKVEFEKYELDLENIDELYSDNLITKGHINLSRNIVLSYKAMNAAASQIKENQSYDSAVKFWADNSQVAPGEKPLSEQIDRNVLINKYMQGERSLQIIYRRSFKNKPPIWMSTESHLYSSPITGEVECFAYTYDINEKILKEQIIKKLNNFGYEFIGYIYPQNKTMIYINLCQHSDKSDEPVIKSGTCEQLLSDVIDSSAAAHDNPVNIAEIIEKLKTDNVYSYSFAVNDKDGKSYQKKINYSYFDIRKDSIFFCRYDITDQYENEQKQILELEEAKLMADRANEAKSLFLSSMSHDLRTPLNGIIGFTEIALKEDDIAKIKEYLTKIRYSGSLLLDLVNDTLELSRIESGKMTLDMQPVNTDELWHTIENVMRPSKPTKRLEVKVEVSHAKNETILTDRVKLQKIFLNLMSNAVKYTPDGGKVSLKVMPLNPPVNGNTRRIIVSDTGIGMSEEFIKKMYEPFTQEKRNESLNVPGTGLGLSIVKRIVDMMGGTISVKSKVNAGTTFTVDLPIKELKDFDLNNANSINNNAKLEGKNVLLCEDNYLNTEIAKILLEDEKMNVVCANNGLEGLEKFKESEPGFYFAVLMDIRMPVMDGYTATREIRKLDRPDSLSIPIIAMTADAFAEDVKTSIDAGMDGHITKPIDSKKLYETLRKLNGGKNENKN